MTAVHTDNYLEETGERWSANKAKAYKDVFLEFLEHCEIPSKELGNIKLGGQLYPAQERGLDAIFAGLQEGVHDFKWGKGRQQGISTLCRPFSTMWAALHPGSRGAFVLDTAQHMAEARMEVECIVNGLPARMKFPLFKSNRAGGKLVQGDKVVSTISFLSAGVKATAAGGALGRGQGVTLCHCSEIGTWVNPEGISSFRKSLAIENPNRLFLWESTGRNVGSDWWKLWGKATANDLEERTIFTGWYLVPTHRIRRGTEMFERFGAPEPTEDEARKIAEVEERYGWTITQEQLAWVRKETNPFGYGGDDTEEAYEDDGELCDEYQSREHPWVEEEMFTMSRSTFFSAERLTHIAKTTISDSFKPYRYFTGTEFIYLTIEDARSRRETQLKVWEEPKPDGVYVVAADPAYGANENNDRSAIQVLRCYADRIEQVAEFCSTMVQPFQFAWIIASIMGYYVNTRLMLEINGPGVAVWQEFSGLKRIVTQGYLRKEAEELGLKNYFQNCKNYLYSRPDALIPGQGSVHWKTTGANKTPMMERLNDFTTNGVLILRSREALDEMRTVTREGDCIQSVGSDHDDRVLALAMGVLCWEQHERKALINSGRTREFEIAKGRLSVQDQFTMLSKFQLTKFFNNKERSRHQEAAAIRRDSWRQR
jgi:hypothetical protein